MFPLILSLIRDKYASHLWAELLTNTLSFSIFDSFDVPLRITFPVFPTINGKQNIHAGVNINLLTE